MADVRVVIPFRPASPERERNFDIVSAHFRELGYPVEVADSGHQRFNRSASRNAGVRAAYDADVLVICDADFIPSADALSAAIAAAPDGRLHYPFTEAIYLDQDETAAFLNTGEGPARSGGDLTGGCFTITPRAWFAAGGMDERFGVWGGEDDAFRIAAGTLLGPWVNHRGAMYHLWHESEAGVRGTPEHDANLALVYRYVDAMGDPDAMRHLIREGSPGAGFPS